MEDRESVGPDFGEFGGLIVADLIVADYSQYQGTVTPPAGQVVIIRAHNGMVPDSCFAANRAAAHRAGCPAVGIYQSLPAAVDAYAGAKLFAATTGLLAPNEWPILDLEDGAGNLQARWQMWRGVIMAMLGRVAWLYSGLAFAQAHDLDPDWVAAYGQAEPTIPHKLWQDTDTYPWPWARSDASVFHGSLAQFLAATGISSAPITTAPAAPPAAPQPAAPEPVTSEPQEVLVNMVISTDGNTIAGVAKDNGDLLVFTRQANAPGWSVIDVTDAIHAAGPNDPRRYQID